MTVAIEQKGEPAVSATAGEFVWKTRRCKRCRGTGVRYCCGERSAEMTCDVCHGGGVERFIGLKETA